LILGFWYFDIGIYPFGLDFIQLNLYNSLLSTDEIPVR
jgi:hypothetical protein